jgi:tetratricopeptide (TPR) repeat protein
LVKQNSRTFEVEVDSGQGPKISFKTDTQLIQNATKLLMLYDQIQYELCKSVESLGDENSKEKYKKERIEAQQKLLDQLTPNLAKLSKDPHNEELRKTVSNFISTNKLDWYKKGNSLRQTNDYDEAIKYYDRSIQIDPKHYHSWYYKGLCLHHQRKYDEAIKSFSKAIDPDKSHYVWFYRGLDHYNLGHYNEAIDDYDKAINIEPSHRQSNYNAGLTLRRLGRDKDVNKYFKKAADLGPEL